LTDILRDFRPDVVHLNGLMAPLVRVCREQRVPHVATAHHPGEACPNGTLLSPGDTICQEAPRAETCVPCICRRKKGGGILAETLARIPPWLYRPAGSFLNHFQNVTYAGRVLMQPWLIEKQLEELRYFHQHAQLLIAPSKNMAQTLIRSGVAADRVMLVPHGIRPLANVPLRPFGSRPVRFGFVGRIDHAKGVHILLQAWDKIPKTLDSELHIIGDAQTLSDKAAFERALTACQDRSRLILHGKLAHPDTLQEMARLDVIILPSICPESFGLVILEAFSLGRPVIVTNCGGPAELVRDGIDGLVVEPNNPSALARALERLAACPAAIIQMAKNLRPVRTLEDHVRDLELLYASARSEAASLGAPASLPALSIQIL
jgi:glycosyltransferase involved in cell wall biosynthesis